MPEEPLKGCPYCFPASCCDASKLDVPVRRYSPRCGGSREQKTSKRTHKHTRSHWSEQTQQSTRSWSDPSLSGQLAELSAAASLVTRRWQPAGGGVCLCLWPRTDWRLPPSDKHTHTPSTRREHRLLEISQVEQGGCSEHMFAEQAVSFVYSETLIWYGFIHALLPLPLPLMLLSPKKLYSIFVTSEHQKIYKRHKNVKL